MVYVIVGATEVGSINLSVRPGQSVKRGDEIGYFAYGGSQLVVLFSHNLSALLPSFEGSHNQAEEQAGAKRLLFSEDLMVESAVPRETLAQVRSEIGRAAM